MLLDQFLFELCKNTETYNTNTHTHTHTWMHTQTDEYSIGAYCKNATIISFYISQASLTN